MKHCLKNGQEGNVLFCFSKTSDKRILSLEKELALSYLHGDVVVVKMEQLIKLMLNSWNTDAFIRNIVSTF